MTTIVIGDAATVFTDAVVLAGGGPELEDSTIHALLDANAVAIGAIGLPMALFARDKACKITAGTGSHWLVTGGADRGAGP